MIRVKAGTRLDEVIRLLAENGQHLPFEPPRFCEAFDETGDETGGGAGTVGGMVATGISGSRRPYAGAVRDYVLGVGLVNADGDYQEFGGQVMKNVAGYDVSRLLVGSMGVLGVIADVTFKVLPRPQDEVSLKMQMSLPDALALFADLRRSGAPISGAAVGKAVGGALVRLSAGAVASQLMNQRNATEVDGGCWAKIDSHAWYMKNVFLEQEGACLWRLSCAPGEPVDFGLSDIGIGIGIGMKKEKGKGKGKGKGNEKEKEKEKDMNWDLIDWGGAQRWLATDLPARPETCGSAHWTLVRAPVRTSAQPQAVEPQAVEPEGGRFQPLPEALMKLHRNLKSTFDPKGKFNPGRLYPDLCPKQ